MVAEVPGVVNHLAKLMADDDISVLHHSTYGSGACWSKCDLIYTCVW